MATDTITIDPDTGDDGSGDGSPSTPYATITGAMADYTYVNTDDYFINIRNTATLSSGDISSAIATWTSGTISNIVFRGVTSGDVRHGFGTYTDITVTPTAGDFLDQPGYDNIHFEGLKIVFDSSTSGNKNLISLDNDCSAVNCWFEFDRESNNDYIWTSDLRAVLDGCYFKLAGGTENGQDCIDVSSDSSVTNCAFIVDGQCRRMLSLGGAGCVAINNVFIVNNTTIGQSAIRLGSNYHTIMHNTVLSLVACTGAGIDCTGTQDRSRVIHNYVEGFTSGTGYDFSGTAALDFRRGNAAFNNSTNFDWTHSAFNQQDGEYWEEVLSASGLTKSGTYDSLLNAFEYCKPASSSDLYDDANREAYFDDLLRVGAVANPAANSSAGGKSGKAKLILIGGQVANV